MRPPVPVPLLESPWEKEADGLAMPAGKVVRLREKMPQNTCPWGEVNDENVVKSPRPSPSRASHNTCPWGTGGLEDAHTAALQRAERIRQKPAERFEGCAGIGAPKRVQPQSNPHPTEQNLSAAQQDSNTASAPVQDTAGFVPTYDSDEDAKERALLIEKCLAHGLSDEEIEGVLREHMFQKELGQVERQEDLGGTIKPANTSVAAQRQAKAMAVKPSYGPSDEEIANVLHEHLSPRDPNDLAQRGRLGKKTEITGKIVATNLGATSSRNAYLDSHKAATAAKNRNRAGEGIF